jgi:hypothetical protein
LRPDRLSWIDGDDRVDVFGRIKNGARNGKLDDRSFEAFKFYDFTVGTAGQFTEFSMQGYAIRKLRTSVNPTRAIRDYLTFLWATGEESEEAQAESFKDPSAYLQHGGRRLPPMRIQMGVWHDRSGRHQAFAFSEIAGTGIVVDIYEAMAEADTYTTPALFSMKPDPLFNPMGNRGLVWKVEPHLDTKVLLHRNMDGEWAPVSPAQYVGINKYLAKHVEVVEEATMLATDMVTMYGDFTSLGLGGGWHHINYQTEGASCNVYFPGVKHLTHHSASARKPLRAIPLPERRKAEQGDGTSGPAFSSLGTSDKEQDDGNASTPDIDISGAAVSRGSSTKSVNEMRKAIAPLEVCFERARAHIPDDPSMLRAVGRQITRFQNGVAMGDDGLPRLFCHNKEVRRLRFKCRRAVKEFHALGYNAEFPPPSAAEVLALRYCSPNGGGHGPISALLGELRCLHLFNGPPPSKGSSGMTTVTTTGPESHIKEFKTQLAGIRESMSDTQARMEELDVRIAEVCRDVKDIQEHVHAMRVGGPAAGPSMIQLREEIKDIVASADAQGKAMLVDAVKIPMQELHHAISELSRQHHAEHGSTVPPRPA